MPLLPPELWTITSSFLNHNDLAQVALTSSYLLCLLRPILYRVVSLRSDGNTIQATFDLLKADPSLASKVTDIHLYTRWQNEADWLDLDAIAGMVYLRSMTMVASPFQTEQQQLSFLSVLAKSCPHLSEFTYRQGYYPIPCFPRKPYASEFPSKCFEIAGIKRLCWDDSACFDLTQPLPRSLITASLETITHLSLPSEVDDFGVNDAISFYQFRLPHLKSFEIGSWFFDWDEDGARALVDFLKAHPLIEHFSLGLDGDPFMRIQLPEESVTPDMLPNLRSLHCNISSFLVMIRKDVLMSTNLTELSIGHRFYPEDYRNTREMFRIFETHRGLPSLRILNFDPVEILGDRSLRLFKKEISQLPSIFPLLEEWSASTFPIMKIKALVSLLSGFPLLSHIKFPRTMFRRGISDIVTIASRCPTLRMVTVQPTKELDANRIVYHIERDGFGTVCRLVAYEYDLYDCWVATLSHDI